MELAEQQIIRKAKQERSKLFTCQCSHATAALVLRREAEGTGLFSLERRGLQGALAETFQSL